MVRDYPETRLGRLCDRLGVPCVSMLATFDENSERVLPYIDGHLNRVGHTLTAEALHDKCIELGWTK